MTTLGVTKTLNKLNDGKSVGKDELVTGKRSGGESNELPPYVCMKK